jgi:Sulfotransferase family
MAAPSAGPRLCFVISPAFHGATLLSVLLSNHSEVTALGDTVPLRSPESPCSCGVGFQSCAFWQTVSARLDIERYAQLPTLLPPAPWPLERPPGSSPTAAFLRRLEYGLWEAELGLAQRGLPLVSAWARRPLQGFALAYQAFYQLVSELHGTSVVVDGTKSQEKFRSLRRYFGDRVDMSVIHLVRDPRGFARSWISYTGEEFEEGARRWRDYHEGVVRMREADRLLTVRYEDICEDPKREVDRIFSFLSIETEDVLGPPRYPKKNHILGNRMLESFTGEIREDERWKVDMSELEQQAVLRCAGAMAAHFNYGLNSAPEGESWMSTPFARRESMAGFTHRLSQRHSRRSDEG